MDAPRLNTRHLLPPLAADGPGATAGPAAEGGTVTFAVPGWPPGASGAQPPQRPHPSHRAEGQPLPAAAEPRPAPPPLTICADLLGAAAVLDAQLGRCRRQARLAAVLWVDVVVGEADAGRSLLQAMGQRLRHRVRATDSVMQVGTQGFAVLLTDAGEQASALVRDRLGAVLQGPYRVAHARMAPLLLRLGRAVHGLDGQDAASLLRVAARLGASDL